MSIFDAIASVETPSNQAERVYFNEEGTYQAKLVTASCNPSKKKQGQHVAVATFKLVQSEGAEALEEGTEVSWVRYFAPGAPGWANTYAMRDIKGLCMGITGLDGGDLEGGIIGQVFEEAELFEGAVLNIEVRAGKQKDDGTHFYNTYFSHVEPSPAMKAALAEG